MALRNYHSATAILTGLRASGVKDMELPYVALLDSADNYTIYRSVVSKEPGLPFVYPHVNEMISACKPLSLPDSSECIGLLRAQGIEVETGGIFFNSPIITNFNRSSSHRSSGKYHGRYHCPFAGLIQLRPEFSTEWANLGP